MAKTTQYFKHDYNARNDLKMELLIQEQGMVGVGIFWCLVEILYEEDGEIEKSTLPSIARKLRVHLPTLQKVIKDYGLFQESAGETSGNSGKVWSNSVKVRLNLRKLKSETARYSALSRWEKDANAMRTHIPDGCERNATSIPPHDKQARLEAKTGSPPSPPSPTPLSPVTPVPPQRREEKSTTPTPSKGDGFVLPGWLDKDTWDAFVEMRKAAKAPLTTHARALLIMKLDGFRKSGQDVKEVLNQSIMSNWKGVFPLKEQNSGRNKGNPRTLTPPGCYTSPEDYRRAGQTPGLGGTTGTTPPVSQGEQSGTHV